MFGKHRYLLIAILALIMAACGNSNTSQTNDQNNGNVTTVQSDTQNSGNNMPSVSNNGPASNAQPTSRFAAINITNHQASPFEESMSVFSRSDEVDVNFVIDNVQKGDEVTGKIMAIDAPGFSPSILILGKDTHSAFGIADKDYGSTQSWLWFSTSNPNLWPTGTYKINVYFNNKLDTVFEFTVR